MRITPGITPGMIISHPPCDAHDAPQLPGTISTWQSLVPPEPRSFGNPFSGLNELKRLGLPWGRIGSKHLAVSLQIQRRSVPNLSCYPTTLHREKHGQFPTFPALSRLGQIGSKPLLLLTY